MRYLRDPNAPKPLLGQACGDTAEARLTVIGTGLLLLAIAFLLGAGWIIHLAIESTSSLPQ